jgi:tetratricopeptide (TPR) repeat protein
MKDYEKAEAMFQHVLIEMEREYHTSKSVNSFVISSIGKLIHLENYIVYIALLLGLIYRINTRFTRSIMIFEKALEIGIPPSLAAATYMWLGDLYKLQNYYLWAVSCYLQCLEYDKLYRKETSFVNKALIYLQIGEIFEKFQSKHTGRQFFNPKNLAIMYFT